MSLKPGAIQPVPEDTLRVAQAAFPKGGQPGLPPWRLALVTILQFRENLSDRQAAEAVRARIDWKYLLGLELTDAGFDFSVLSEFRTRLLRGALKPCCWRKYWTGVGL